ncbi:MAG TPA: endonuclease/exonuclease/phosphatase family protein [Cytophaga sp.]|nr:endonuclease/exonuclease/phosphatase family protein [Cytophaga sp.]
MKSLIIIFILLVTCLLVFRNHFIFGTALIIGRWGFLLVGLLLLFLTTKRITPKRLQYILLGSLLFVCVEFIFTKLNEATPKEISSNTELTLMTYNLFFKNKNPDVILKQIKETNPDILVVQELTPQWVHLLSKSLEHMYPYKTIYADKGTHGMGVYSKYKLSSDTLLLNQCKKPFAQIVNVRVFNKKIQIINTHTASPAAAIEHPENFLSYFNSNYAQREKQFTQIEGAAENSTNAISILIGDLNTTCYEPLYRNLRNNWVDVFNEIGEGSNKTFPNTSRSKPFLTLDYIFIKGAITPVSARILSGGSSDHLALVGKIKI